MVDDPKSIELGHAVREYSTAWHRNKKEAAEAERRLRLCADEPRFADMLIEFLVVQRISQSTYLAETFGLDITEVPPRYLPGYGPPSGDLDRLNMHHAMVEYYLLTTAQMFIPVRVALAQPAEAGRVALHTLLTALRIQPEAMAQVARVTTWSVVRESNTLVVAGYTRSVKKRFPREDRALQELGGGRNYEDVLLETLPSQVQLALEGWDPPFQDLADRVWAGLTEGTDGQHEVPVLPLAEYISTPAAEEEFMAHEGARLEARDHLVRAKLSAQQIEVMMLDAQGFLEREIAERLGVHIGAIKKQKDRARRKLEKYYPERDSA